MPFVKLDVGILGSSLWLDRAAREIFITALLMAEPREFHDPQPQIAVRSLEPTGWAAAPGWYGFVPAAGVGIVGRAGVELEAGLAALDRLGAPELDSRSLEHDGRRMIRIDGGFLILNYMRYRDRDHGAAERMRRLRARKKSRKTPAVTRNHRNVHPNVTHSREQMQSTEKEKEGDALTRADTPPALDLEAWATWIRYRRKIKAPIKEASVPAAQRKLAGFGADQAAVVEQSIANGWRGLFDLKDRQQNGTQARGLVV